MRRLLGTVAVFQILLWPTPATFADSLPDILERGTLRIGVSMFPPWTLENPQGELEGFEIEVGRRLAQAMDVEAEFRVYVWDEIIGGLDRNEIDLIAAGMAITPFRASRVDFSDSYSESGVTVAIGTGADSDAIETVKDLDIETNVIAVVDETLAGQAAPLFFDRARVEVFSEPEAAEEALFSGRAQAYLTSVPEADTLVSEFPDRLSIPLAEPLFGSYAGFAVQRGNETLLDYLNSWIAENQDNDWLDSTYDDWFDRR